MLSVVLLSISATFAADNNVDAIAVDEITDEPLAIDEDSQALSEGDVVTNDTFYNYFDAYGSLLANVTSTELTFKGEIANVGLDAINIDRPIKITGDNATITNLVIMVDSSDVVISGLTINQDSNEYAILVFNATNVQIEKTTINFEAVADLNGYAIDAELADNLKLIDNTITYVGTTNGTGINNGIRISESNGATIKGNKFYINLVSAAVAWTQDPSGKWISFPVSEGIVIDSSKDVTFEENGVNVEYVNVIGTYDTIYAVSIKNSDNAVISSNNITANGHTYIYGIQINGQDFLITENNIEVASDNYYANGIDIEGPASGEVDMNTISVTSAQSAYVIYSGMNGADVSVVYANLDLKANAYNVFGFSLGEVKTDIFGVRR